MSSQQQNKFFTGKLAQMYPGGMAELEARATDANWSRFVTVWVRLSDSIRRRGTWPYPKGWVDAPTPRYYR